MNPVKCGLCDEELDESMEDIIFGGNLGEYYCGFDCAYEAAFAHVNAIKLDRTTKKHFRDALEEDGIKVKKGKLVRDA